MHWAILLCSFFTLGLSIYSLREANKALRTMRELEERMKLEVVRIARIAKAARMRVGELP
jgi:hypothetical protein